MRLIVFTLLSFCLLVVSHVHGHASREDANSALRRALVQPALQFHNWALSHNKPYAVAPLLLRSGSNDLHVQSIGVEYNARRSTWLGNARFALDYNAQNLGNWLSVDSPLADLTQPEFKQLLGARPKLPDLKKLSSKIPGFMHDDTDTQLLPNELDWRAKGVVSEVKNQGQCGSCWAFSTTGAVEGANSLFTNNLTSLSEQELVDCDKVIDMGCNGGMMNNAYDFIVANGGLDTESDYPYTAVESPTGCDIAREGRHVVTIDGFQEVPPGDEVALLKAVAHQPVAVAVEADSLPFQLYSGGVLSDPGCGSQLNHGVLLVGYGGLKASGLTPFEQNDDGDEGQQEPYWLIKNSWGSAWGDQGYIRIKMGFTDPLTGQQGLCGITMVASYPVKTSPNPSPSPPTPPPLPPPLPPPTPPREQCDSTHTCPPETTCCCLDEPSKTALKGRVGLCALWGCCPMSSAVCCPDKLHCCPEELPQCDVQSGRCLPGGVNFDKGFSIPMVRNQPATKHTASTESQILPSFLRLARKYLGARIAVA